MQSQQSSKSVPSFKPVALEDIPTLLQLMAAFNAIDNYPFDPQLAAKNLQELISNPNLGRTWIIKLGEKIIGYVVLAFGFSFEFGGLEGNLDEIYLLPEYRGQGIGNQAIDFIIHFAKANQVKAIHLEVEAHNEAGLKLYKNKGFEPYKLVLMSKRL